MEGKKYIKVLKKMMVTFICILVIILCGALVIINNVQAKGEKRIVTKDTLPEKVDAIIVLGAGVREDGTPSDILTDRLSTSLDILNMGVEGKLLLSGDHGKEGYNEVGTMKDYILKNSDIKEKDIFLDHAGFSTYDSIYRAKDIFKVESAIIITNEYHLPRALYLAEKLGIDAYGYTSDKREYYYMDAYKKREKIAQLKDFLFVNVLKPEPKFLGDSIPVNTSDGRDTEG
ncbi:YdcF family protein [Clostridium paraputrificum]|uniref:SanA/YdcF family protein n=1 Tax=Clostridium TaxID=1485 RepID=UPI00189DB34F|nr:MULTISPECIES: ElyC/SanA/YdcF family protein [Clostridium]MDB2074444.1 YdcF family protein [Clostridium paraputrificum]MDB2077585.1 YdcF family protein [Clostridium paraputrificum]MDB2084654.1 YdcF family protein [Clostridium paraputrificum]MDB2092239.1 YdcF family protein [Clostridium paraputrificum]MDU5739204.1 ElyC/SanA/YdcF family protein [Clostridium sp.]